MAINGMAISNTLARGFGWLEHHPVSDIVLKEAIGSNAPKTLVTRTKDERIDVATGQFGGTIAFLTGGWAVQKAAHALFNKISPGVLELPNTEPKRLWAVLGASYAIFATQGALYWAVPFFRNYLTARRSGHENFLQVIGAESLKSNKPQVKSTKLKDRLDYFRAMPLKIVAGGALATASILGLSALKIRQNKPFGQMAKLLNGIALKDGLMRNYNRWASFWFVAVASYVGWIHAVRDKFELKEQLLQFGTFVTAFFLPQPLIESQFKKITEKSLPDYANKLFQNADGSMADRLTLENIERVFKSAKGKTLAKSMKAQNLCIAQNLLGAGFSIVMLGTLPQLLNWELTKKRLHHAEQMKRLDTVQTSFKRFIEQAQSKQQVGLMSPSNAFAT